MKTKTETQPDVTAEALMSQAKAAELCGMTRAAIHDLVRRGRFHSVEVEGRNLVSDEGGRSFRGGKLDETKSRQRKMPSRFRQVRRAESLSLLG